MARFERRRAERASEVVGVGMGWEREGRAEEGGRRPESAWPVRRAAWRRGREVVGEEEVMWRTMDSNLNETGEEGLGGFGRAREEDEPTPPRSRSWRWSSKVSSSVKGASSS